MFFFFNENFERASFYDLDVFLYDNLKLIHFATAGMNIFKPLDNNEILNSENLKKVLTLRRVYKYGINPEIQRDNILNLNEYTSFFELMAKRGFYSYDRVYIDNQDDYTFQLIAKPIYNKRIIVENTVELGDFESQYISTYNFKMPKAKFDFPEDYQYFDLRKFV